MLDDAIKLQLKAYLERITQPIELLGSLDDSAKSQEMRELLQDIAAQSDKIALSLDGDDARKPSFAIRRAGAEPGVTFAGMPMGHEFTSLVLALLQVGGHPAKVSAGNHRADQGAGRRLSVRDLFLAVCQNCPDVVQALNLMAALNPKIRHVAIDGALFQEEVEARQIMAVPSIYLERRALRSGTHEPRADPRQDRHGRRGAHSGKAQATRRHSTCSSSAAVPAGAAAAIYAARKGIRTGVVAERFGGQVLDTMAIENFISVPHTEGPEACRRAGAARQGL